MSTNGKKQGKIRRKSPTGRHVRFPAELVQWIEGHARERGFNSDADLIRHAVREYRQREEQAKSATA